MTPIERVSSKNRAFSILGLPSHANTAEIRASYRRLAFEKHPDRGTGSSEDFAMIADAYHFLTENFQELGIQEPAPEKPKPRTVSRPTAKPSETQFSDETRAECQASFQASVSDDPQHVPSQLYRTGRNLTYFVPTAATKGVNQVALPTGQLVDARHVRPEVISVDSRDLSGGVFEVPPHVCAQRFPGAHSVKIRFAF